MPLFRGAAPVAAAAILAGLCLRSAAEDTYYSVLVDGKRSGYEHITTDRGPDGIKSVDDTRIKLTALGAPLEESIQSIVLYSPGGKPLRFTASIKAGSNEPVTTDCRWELGKVKISSGGDSHTFPWTANCYLLDDETIRSEASFARILHSGNGSVTVKYVDVAHHGLTSATLTRLRNERIETNGKTRMCHIYGLSSDGTDLQFAYDSVSGHVVEFRNIPAKVAVLAADSSAMKDLVSVDIASRAFATTDTPLSPFGLSHVKIKVDATLAMERPSQLTLNTAWQHFDGKIIGNHLSGVLDISQLSYDGRNSPPFTGHAPAETSLEQFIKPEQNVQCDDPAIVKLAREITAGAKTDWEAASRIGKWVNTNIAYEITGSGARQCLATRQGDCGPHSWLTIALCRAAGVPARITGGALYSDLLGGSFGQHYWTLVWMGEKDRWIPIDSTSGEIGVFSPTHLTLWRLGALQSLSVKVIDYAPKQSAVTSFGSKQSLIMVHQGDKVRYSLSIDGKPAGVETAECVKVNSADPVSSEWQTSATIKAGSTAAPMEESLEGGYIVDGYGRTKHLDIHVAANNVKEEILFDLRPAQFHGVITMGGTPFNRDIPRKEGDCLIMSELTAPLSLIIQSMHPSPGQTISLPLVVANNLARAEIKLTVATAPETITVGGKAESCIVANTSSGLRLWLDPATGAIQRAAISSAKLVIERE